MEAVLPSPSKPWEVTRQSGALTWVAGRKFTTVERVTQQLPSSPPATPSVEDSEAFESVRSQLVALPPVPADIIEAQSATRSNLGDPEDSQSLPPVTTKTYQDQCRSQSTFLDSSPDVLVRSRVHYISTQRVYVAPDMALSDGLKSIWIRQIQEPLRIVLRHGVHSGSCVQELMMAGKKQDQLRPFVVVTCGNKKVQKEVEKAIKNLDWLTGILKSNRIGLVALIGEALLSAGRSKASRSAHSIKLCLEDVGDTAWLCGRRLKLSNENCCTIGGVVVIDEKRYAFTAGHAFPSTVSEVSDSVLAPTESHAHEAHHGGNGDGDDDFPDQPFWLNGSDDESDHNSRQSAGDLSDSEGDHEAERGYGCTQSVKWSATDFVAQYSASTASEDDWAVIEISARSDLAKAAANEQCPDPRCFTQFATEEHDGDVYIPCGDITYKGYLSTLPCSLHIGTVACHARRITMTKPLPLGCSGSWVGRENQLLGHVVATRQDVPWAYMIPIRHTLQSLKMTLSSDKIELLNASGHRGLSTYNKTEPRANSPIKRVDIHPLSDPATAADHFRSNEIARPVHQVSFQSANKHGWLQSFSNKVKNEKLDGRDNFVGAAPGNEIDSLLEIQDDMIEQPSPAMVATLYRELLVAEDDHAHWSRRWLVAQLKYRRRRARQTAAMALMPPSHTLAEPSWTSRWWRSYERSTLVTEFQRVERVSRRSAFMFSFRRSHVTRRLATLLIGLTRYLGFLCMYRGREVYKVVWWPLVTPWLIVYLFFWLFTYPIRHLVVQRHRRVLTDPETIVAEDERGWIILESALQGSKLSSARDIP